MVGTGVPPSRAGSQGTSDPTRGGSPDHVLVSEKGSFGPRSFGCVTPCPVCVSDPCGSSRTGGPRVGVGFDPLGSWWAVGQEDRRGRTDKGGRVLLDFPRVGSCTRRVGVGALVWVLTVEWTGTSRRSGRHGVSLVSEERDKPVDVPVATSPLLQTSVSPLTPLVPVSGRLPPPGSGLDVGTYSPDPPPGPGRTVPCPFPTSIRREDSCSPHQSP